MVLVSAALALLLVACRAQPSEAERFVDALDHQDAGRCRQLSAPGRVEECITLIAAATNAPALCEGLETFWRDECFFYLIDRTSPPIEKALALCARTGEYRHNCTEHRLNAAIDQLFRQKGAAAGYARLDVLLAPHVPDAVRPKMITHVLSRHRFEQLSADEPLTTSVCAGVPDNICERIVYTHLIRATSAHTSSLREALCPGPVSAEAAVSLGLPGWDAGLEPFAQAALDSYCRRRRRAQDPPPPKGARPRGR